MEIALTVADKFAFIILAATNAVAMLTSDYVGTCVYERMGKLAHARGWVAAVFFTAVVNYNYLVGIYFCLANIGNSVVAVKGARTHTVFERVRIFVLTNANEGYFFTIFLKVIVFARILVIFAKTGVWNTRFI